MTFREFCEEDVQIPEMKPQIFVDMDGVLVDFTKAWMDLSGEKIDGFEYERIHGKDKFWDIIGAAGEEFWVNMPWTPDGKALWIALRPLNPRI